MRLKPHQTAILTAVVIGVLSTCIPFVSGFFYPVLWLNTHFHELCHALATWATGGYVQDIHVFSNGGGVTMIGGGIPIVDASAGYVGSSIIGALTIFFSRTPNSARVTLWVLSAMLAFSMIVLVRGDFVGILSGVFWTAALYGLSRLKGVNLMFVGELLGVLLCLNAMQALYFLLHFSAFSEGTTTDASILQADTGIPAMVWALSWGGFSLVMMGLALQRAWVRPIAGAASSGQ